MSLADHSSTIDACRFCFMCRHVCTTGVVTGRESDTPRGRALVLFKILKGHAAWSDELVDAVYRCCLCGLCRTWCKAECSPPDAILAARREIVAQGRAPAAAEKIRRNLLDHGNPFGLPRDQRFQKIDTVETGKPGADVLYYVGCDAAYRRPEIAQAMLTILRAAGVDATMLADEHSTGKPLALLGYADDARAMAASLAEKIRKTGCTTIVTTCPSSFDALAVDYPALGASLEGIEVLHAVSYLRRLADEDRLPSLRIAPTTVAVLDDTYLGRRHGLFDAPRGLVASIAGATLVEMTWSRDLAHACGEPGGVFHCLYPELSAKLARRVLDEAVRSGAHVLATNCPATKHILAQEDCAGIGVRDIVEFVADAI